MLLNYYERPSETAISLPISSARTPDSSSENFSDCSPSTSAQFSTSASKSNSAEASSPTGSSSEDKRDLSYETKTCSSEVPSSDRITRACLETLKSLYPSTQAIHIHPIEHIWQYATQENAVFVVNVSEIDF